MSGKLDQSLDQIMTDRKSANAASKPRRQRPQRGAAQKAKAAIAPTGGVQKNTKAPKNAPKGPAVSQPSGDSKIIVSNLPLDVSETLIKDFFGKAIGGVKKVLVAYGPNGQSRGEATVIFNKGDSAAKAQQQYNSVKVDGRPMRIELVGTAAVAAAAKPLSDRMAKPKNAAKENTKAAAAAGKKGGPKAAGGAAANGEKKGKGKKSGRAGRPKPKTAEELDAEMQDYFGGGDNAAAPAAAATNGAAQPVAAAPATADTGMEDEVL